MLFLEKKKENSANLDPDHEKSKYVNAKLYQNMLKYVKKISKHDKNEVEKVNCLKPPKQQSNF